MGNDSMTIVGHLEELRQRIIKLIIVHLIIFVIVFLKADEILTMLLGKNPTMNIVYIEPSEVLTVYMEIAVYIGIALCLPFTAYQIWAFVSPGLHKNEKITVIVAILMSFIFFILGALFAYVFVVPFTLRFFSTIVIDQIDPMVSVKSYIGFFLGMVLALGLIFNMPTLVYLTTKWGLIKPDTLKKYNRHIIVVIAIFAAVITPADVFSMFIVLVPMVLLLLLSNRISSFVYKRMVKKGQVKNV